MDRANNILLLILIIILFYLLYALQSILQPLVLALLFAVMFQPLIIFLESKKVPRAIIVPCLSILTIVVLFILLNIILSSFSQILTLREFLTERLYLKFQYIISSVSKLTNSQLDMSIVMKSAKNILDTSYLSRAAGSVATKISSFAGSFVMFAIYYIVLLSGMSNYKRYLHHVGGDDGEGRRLIKNYETIQRSVFSYLTIKAFISLLTGVFAGVVLALFDIKFALLFAFLTFLLNFIPTIGSIIASFPPIAMAIIQYDTLTPAIALAVLLMGVQMTMGNFIEPKLLGNRLRLNTVTVIFGLLLWGYLWGIIGMIVSVPLMVTLKLAFEHFPSTQILSRVMSYPEKN